MRYVYLFASDGTGSGFAAVFEVSLNFSNTQGSEQQPHPKPTKGVFERIQNLSLNKRLRL